MPTYDYVCDACGHRLELYQSITAPPQTKCPHCGKRTLQRLIGTGGGIIFKGSGFYQTDYRSESYKKAAAAEKTPAPAANESQSSSAKPSEKATTTAAEKSTAGAEKTTAGAEKKKSDKTHARKAG